MPPESIASSSTQLVPYTPCKTYDFHDIIKDFLYHMPNDWYNKEVNIFIQACKENIDVLRNPDRNDKWELVAESGANKSLNPVLFSVKRCMLVAQCISKVFSNVNNFIYNQASIDFWEENFDLIEYFETLNNVNESFSSHGTSPPIIVQGFLFEHEKIEKLINLYVSSIPRGFSAKWWALETIFEDNLDIPLEEIKDYLEETKFAVIHQVYQEDDLYKKMQIFNKYPCIVDIFDIIEPTTVTKQNIFNKSDTKHLEAALKSDSKSVDIESKYTSDSKSLGKEETNKIPHHSRASCIQYTSNPMKTTARRKYNVECEANVDKLKMFPVVRLKRLSLSTINTMTRRKINVECVANVDKLKMVPVVKLKRLSPSFINRMTRRRYDDNSVANSKKLHPVTKVKR